MFGTTRKQTRREAGRGEVANMGGGKIKRRALTGDRCDSSKKPKGKNQEEKEGTQPINRRGKGKNLLFVSSSGKGKKKSRPPCPLGGPFRKEDERALLGSTRDLAVCELNKGGKRKVVIFGLLVKKRAREVLYVHRSKKKRRTEKPKNGGTPEKIRESVDGRRGRRFVRTKKPPVMTRFGARRAT